MWSRRPVGSVEPTTRRQRGADDPSAAWSRRPVGSLEPTTRRQRGADDPSAAWSRRPVGSVEPTTRRQRGADHPSAAWSRPPVGSVEPTTRRQCGADDPSAVWSRRPVGSVEPTTRRRGGTGGGGRMARRGSRAARGSPPLRADNTPNLALGGPQTIPPPPPIPPRRRVVGSTFPASRSHAEYPKGIAAKPPRHDGHRGSASLLLLLLCGHRASVVSMKDRSPKPGARAY